MKKLLSIIALGCTLATSAQTYTLQQLKDSAMHNNIAIRKAQYDIDASQQQRKEAFTKYFPNVSGVGFAFNTNKGMAQMDIHPSELIPSSLGEILAASLPPEALAALGSPVSMTLMKKGAITGVTAVQPVFAGGQIVNGNRLAKVGEDVSRLQFQLSENEVEKQTEKYYWQLVVLQEKMKTVEAVEALLADIGKDIEVAVKAGLAMRNDWLQVQIRQNDNESQKVKLQNNIDIVRLTLAQYCGLKSDVFSIDTPEEIIAEIPLEQEPNSSLASLPEYQLLQKQVQAADIQRKMVIGKILPTIGVGGGYNYHNMLGNNHTFGMVFATVCVPISDWWGGSHAIKRKRIAQRQAEEQLADNAELLKIRMQKSWNDVQESIQQLVIAKRSIEQAEENLRLNRDYYKAGISKMSDLLESQMLYQQALDKHTDAIADYRNKLLEYRQCTGLIL